MSLVGDEVDLYSQYPQLTTDEGEMDLYDYVDQNEVDLYGYVDLGQVDPYALGRDVEEVDPYAIGRDIEEVDPYAIGSEVCSIDSDCLTPGEICVEGRCVAGTKTIVAAPEAEELRNSDSDCPPGQVCAYASPGAEAGKCVACEETTVVIHGILDEKTCSYCRSQIGAIRSIDSVNLPPFHKYCRCWVDYVGSISTIS